MHHLLESKKFLDKRGVNYTRRHIKEENPIDGMLVKRPILVGNGFVLTGFRQSEWEEKL